MKLIEHMKNWKWARIVIFIAVFGLTIAVIKVDSLLNSVSLTFKNIVEMPRLFHCIIGGAMIIALFHLIFVPKGGIAKEHLLYKRVGPIFSVPLTVLTHGLFIYCGLLIIYLFCYDDATIMKYDKLDKTTVGLTMLTLMTYAVYSISLILSDIFNPKEDKMGTILEENNEGNDTPE